MNTDAIALLNGIQNIILKAGEVDFDELRGREKREIFDLIVNSGFEIIYDYDKSTGHHLAIRYVDRYMIINYSGEVDDHGIPKGMNGLHFNGWEEGDNSVEHIDSIINQISVLSVQNKNDKSPH